MATITGNWSITINVDGTNYTFTDPNPITDLMDTLTNEQNTLAVWNQRVTDCTNNIANLQAQIQALCVATTG